MHEATRSPSRPASRPLPLSDATANDGVTAVLPPVISLYVRSDGKDLLRPLPLAGLDVPSRKRTACIPSVSPRSPAVR